MSVGESRPRACSSCPWRLDNQGQRHRHGFYSAANLKRLWTGLRTGAAPGMTCHPTDSRMVEFEGYEQTADRDAVECAGAIVLVAREVFRFQAICHELESEGRKDGLAEYRRRHPKGLARGALADIVWRFLVGGTFLARRISVTPDALNDPEVGYEPLGAWDPETLERAGALVVQR